MSTAAERICRLSLFSCQWLGICGGICTQVQSTLANLSWTVEILVSAPDRPVPYSKGSGTPTITGVELGIRVAEMANARLLSRAEGHMDYRSPWAKARVRIWVTGNNPKLIKRPGFAVDNGKNNRRITRYHSL